MEHETSRGKAKPGSQPYPVIIIRTHRALSGLRVRAVFNRDAGLHLVFLPLDFLCFDGLRNGAEPH